MAKGDFGNKRNSNGFAKNPQNINRKGAPRKTLKIVNDELELLGITEASSSDITSCYLRIVNMTILEVETRVRDANETLLFRVVGKAVLSGKGFDIIEKMLDRSIGKAQQSVDITTKGNEIQPTKVVFKKFDDAE